MPVRKRSVAKGRSPRRSRAAPSRARRARVANPSPERLAIYSVAVELPDDAVGTEFSLRHPDIRLEVTNRMEVTPSRLLEEVRAHGEHADTYLEEVRHMPDVTDAWVYPESDGTAIYRMIVRTPLIQDVIQRHRVLTRYPMVVQGGWLRFDTVAAPGQIRLMMKDLHRRIGRSVVEAVRKGTFRTGVLHLTPPQETVFRAALAGGFFSHPRRISVSQLAHGLGRSKSTISVALAQIQSQLVHAALQIEQATFTPRSRGAVPSSQTA